MQKVKSTLSGKGIIDFGYPYLNGHRITVSQDDIGYFVRREYINGDDTSPRFYRISDDEFNAFNSIEYDASNESGYASKLLSEFRRLESEDRMYE
jgi:hypothetical protein